MKHFVLALAICALGAAIALERSGIDVAKLAPPQGSITYTDRNGIALGTILGAGSSHSASVALDSVSPIFLDAILAAEDARFWRHGAVDVRALLRAARDYAIFGGARSGGSTIEMQLARLLSPGAGASSEVVRKLEQIALAERIEVASSKTAVLVAYVNRVPMGGNVYGVEAAARTYFGEPATDLDLAQASLLAAIPNDPARLAPDADWQALRARQRYVLHRMVDLGEITPATAGRAFAETLNVRFVDSGIDDAPHALFSLYGTGGLRGGRVRTTLDRTLQRFVQAQTQNVIGALQRYHVTGGAALVVDNRTGDVLAYVGSPDYFSDEALGRNDGVRALRQPGSSLKPFTYELALERGTIRSTTILPDVAAAYAIPGGKLYEPGDYSGRFSGPVRVRYALANSLNVPAVRVLSRLGVEPFLARLHDLGFAHLDRTPAYYGLGLTLGSGEVSLWELVQAYVAMARGGSFLALHLTGGPQRLAPSAIPRPGHWSPTCWPIRTRGRTRSACTRCSRCRSRPRSKPERRRIFTIPGPSDLRTTTRSAFGSVTSTAARCAASPASPERGRSGTASCCTCTNATPNRRLSRRRAASFGDRSVLRPDGSRCVRARIVRPSCESGWHSATFRRYERTTNPRRCASSFQPMTTRSCSTSRQTRCRGKSSSFHCARSIRTLRSTGA